MRTFIFLTIAILIAGCQPKTIQEDGGIIVKINALGYNDNVRKTIERRLEKSGLHDYVISESENDFITIEIPDYTDTLFIKKLISAQGNLCIEETYNAPEVFEHLIKINKKLAQIEGSDTGSIQNENPLFAKLSPPVNAIGTLIESPVIGYSKSKDTAYVMTQLRKFKSFYPHEMYVRWGSQIQTDYFPLIAIHKSFDLQITSEMVESSEIQKFGRGYDVNIALKSDYEYRLSRITRNNISRSLALMIDDFVYSYPTVTSEIIGGKVSITNNFDYNKAVLLSSLLNSSPLDVKIVDLQLITH